MRGDRTFRPWAVPAMLAAGALVLTACGGPSGSGGGSGAGGGAAPAKAVMFSTQLAPVEEAEKMRTQVLAGFSGEVEFIGSEAGPFADRVRSDAKAGATDVSVLGGLHGDFAAFAGEDLLMDLSDVAADLKAAGISKEYLDLGKLGTDQQLYIPWMQATYIMVANKDALQYLPSGADVNKLTWAQLGQWGKAITDATGERKLGFPAGEKGLLHRFLEGYAYPSFTGGLNTTFAGADAVAMWNYLKDTWNYVNPQSTTYGFMQEPLRSGEVWVAWDHVARLIEALRAEPDKFVAFPAPSGPKGLGFMPVVAGLAIPKASGSADVGKALIKYLLTPETQKKTLEQVAFFPVIGETLPGDLAPGIKAEQQAVAAQTQAANAVPSLLPVGLGDQNGAYNQVFKDAFQQIVIDGGDPAAVLAGLKANLQQVLDTAKAACWAPDPASTATCQVQ